MFDHYYHRLGIAFLNSWLVKEREREKNFCLWIWYIEWHYHFQTSVHRCLPQSCCKFLQSVRPLLLANAHYRMAIFAFIPPVCVCAITTLVKLPFQSLGCSFFFFVFDCFSSPSLTYLHSHISHPLSPLITWPPPAVYSTSAIPAPFLLMHHHDDDQGKHI